MTKEQVNEIIRQYIKENGKQEITGSVLQKVLIDITGNYVAEEDIDDILKDTDLVTLNSSISTALGGKIGRVNQYTGGNLPIFTTDGSLSDSGKKPSDFLTSHQDISKKADKVSGATNNNLASLNSNGNLKDSGVAASEIVTKSEVRSLVPEAADNLSSWVGREDISIEVNHNEDVFLVGDVDENATVTSIVPKDTIFKAASISSTGFNLLRNATAVGNGWYFKVPTLEYSGTADKPNGILFTDSQGNNLTPNVYFLKGLIKPTSNTSGTRLTPKTVDGYNFYTTTEPGFMIVSGISRNTVCAHVAWGDRYDDYVSIDDNNDAGSTVYLTSIINTCHSDSGLLYKVGSAVDYITFSGTTATWHRNCNRSSPTWTTTDNGDGTYTHSATLTDMKPGGQLFCPGIFFKCNDVNSGVSVYYTSDSATPTTEFVYYEILIPVSGTISLASVNPSIKVNRHGLIMFSGNETVAATAIIYKQKYPEYVAELVSDRYVTDAQALVKAIVALEARISALEGRLGKLGNATAGTLDVTMLTQNLYPTILYGHGAPSSTTRPINLPDNLPWDGIPAFIGQEYINIDITSGGKYYSKGTTAVSDWIK